MFEIHHEQALQTSFTFFCSSPPVCMPRQRVPPNAFAW